MGAFLGVLAKPQSGVSIFPFLARGGLLTALVSSSFLTVP